MDAQGAPTSTNAAALPGATNASSKKKTNKRPRDRPSSQKKNKRPKADTFSHVADTQLHAARIATRQRDIDKGKNTAGYAAYREQVPLTARKPRSMETPSTPQPTWDVSVKRWQGLVRAWRKSLHHYDPPEILRSPAAASPMIEDTTPISILGGTTTAVPVVERKCTPVRMLDFSAAAMDGDSSDDDDELL